MNIPKTAAICLILVSVCRLSFAQPTTAPSINDITADLGAQRYQDVVRKSGAALQARGGLVGPDRVSVLEMKAEAHLRQRQFTPAADTYMLALKEVAPDSPAAAKYQATARLLKSLNSGGQYQPKGAPSASAADRAVRPSPINVSDPATREDALMAFYNDERRSVEALIDRLKQQRTLPLIQNAILKVDEVRILELGATGSDVASKALLDPLKDHSAAVLQAPLELLTDKIEQISKLASKDRTFAQTVTPGGVRQEVSQKVGLTAGERTEMQGVARDLTTIIEKSQELGRKLGVTVESTAGTRRGRGSSPVTLQKVYTDANEQLKLAMGLLDANYVSTPVNATRGRASRPAQGGD